MFPFMPFQAYKENRALLQSIGVRMLHENVPNTLKYNHFHIIIPPASTHQRVASLRFALACHIKTPLEKKHQENYMFSSMPLQAHKTDRSRLHSMGVRMHQERAETHGNIIISTLPSHPQPAVTSEQSPACGVKRGAGGRRPKALK